MEPKHLSRAAGLLLLLFLCQFSFASNGSIMGQVTDPDSKQPVGDAVVLLDCQGNQLTFITNEHGYYYASNIPAGVYTITVSYFGHTSRTEGVKLSSDEVKEVNLLLSSAIQMPDIVITSESPMIDPVDPTGNLLEHKEIKDMPITKITDIACMQPGITEINGEFYVRGARAGSLSYYIDNCKVMGEPEIPLCGLDTYRTYTGFIPPKYGDTTGGVVVMETRNYFGEARN